MLQATQIELKESWHEKTWEVHHICSSEERESQIFIHFTLQSTVSKILHILGFPIDSHVNISMCHIFFKKLADCQEN